MKFCTELHTIFVDIQAECALTLRMNYGLDQPINGSLSPCD